MERLGNSIIMTYPEINGQIISFAYNFSRQFKYMEELVNTTK